MQLDYQLLIISLLIIVGNKSVFFVQIFRINLYITLSAFSFFCLHGRLPFFGRSYTVCLPTHFLLLLPSVTFYFRIFRESLRDSLRAPVQWCSTSSRSDRESFAHICVWNRFQLAKRYGARVKGTRTGKYLFIRSHCTAWRQHLSLVLCCFSSACSFCTTKSVVDGGTTDFYILESYIREKRNW